MRNKLILIISASLILLGSFFLLAQLPTKKQGSSAFESFFPSERLHTQFESLKNKLLTEGERLNELENPPEKELQNYDALWDSLYALNKQILDKRFTIDTSSKGKRLSYFNFVNYAISNCHAGLEVKEERYDYRWKQIAEHYRPLVRKVKNDDEFIFLMDEMISLLDDAHTWIGYRKNQLNRSLEVGFEKAGQHFTVNGFYLKYLSDSLDIGDRLISIDGKNPADLYKKVKAKTIFADYPQTDEVFQKRFFRSYYFYRLTDKKPETCLLKLQKPNGTVYHENVSWKPVRWIRNMYGARIHSKKKTGISGHIIKEGNYAYVKIDKWHSKYIPTFDSLYNAMKHTNAFIIDIRNNFGGDYTNFGQRVLGKFLEEDKVTLYKQFRNSPLYHLYGFGGLHYQDETGFEKKYFPMEAIECRNPDSGKYNKPVVLLVNGKHFSSNDLFIIAYHELGIGAIAGRLNPFQLLGQPIYSKATPWNDWKLGLSVMVPYSAGKKLYEDQIIHPDIEVPLTREEIYKQSDPILEAALEYLNGLN